MTPRLRTTAMQLEDLKQSLTRTPGVRLMLLDQTSATGRLNLLVSYERPRDYGDRRNSREKAEKSLGKQDH